MDKKNIQLSDYQRRILREYYRGSRAPRHLKVYHLSERIQKAGLLPDDGLKYPSRTAPRTRTVSNIPYWVYVQAHRVAMRTILLPEAYEILTPGLERAKMTRGGLLKVLDIPKSSYIYKKIAPKLTEETASELVDLDEYDQLPKDGCAPWWDRKNIRSWEKHAYPPIECDPWLDDWWYDKFCLDREGLLGEPEPVLWATSWSSQLIRNKARTIDPPASDSTFTAKPKPEPSDAADGPESDGPSDELKDKLFDLFD